ncbi:hypothetical protein NQ315_013020 [Exocentrus adspersus]|uniref:Uncharacterized protein n=1 Tax=Exocentrus adspersus TaxID=1586481 RepID=A0AAV8VAV5_9CUCU|nr:hypothetical protein NQ315_013020 [Exocentrus adspersus]
MEPKSPTGYEKLVEEKPPKSPSRPFRLKFHRMLSTGSLKLGSTFSSPSSPCSEGGRYSFDSDTIEQLKKAGFRLNHGVPKRKNFKRKFMSFRRNRTTYKKQNVTSTAPSILVTLVSDEEGYDDLHNIIYSLECAQPNICYCLICVKLWKIWTNSAENSRPNSFSAVDRKLLLKEQEKLEKKLR